MLDVVSTIEEKPNKDRSVAIPNQLNSEQEKWMKLLYDKQSCNRNLKFTNIVTDVDVLNIYKDVSKISAIENYLHILYRPFECRLKTGCRLKLSELATHLSKTDYNPDKSSALLVRFVQPTCSLKVFNNGYITCRGFSYESAIAGCKNIMSLMENIGLEPQSKQPNYNVVNATFRVPFPINLRRLYFKHLPRCYYNPITQPYLVYEMNSLKIKLAIFPMGQVYVMLSSQPSYTRKAIAFILPILYRYREVAVKINELEQSVGDVNFQLLWEKDLQTSYHKCVPSHF